MTHRRPALRGLIKSPLLWMFVTSLVVRLAFIELQASAHSNEELSTLSPDIGNYYRAAGAIHDRFQFDDNAILTFGPGYPTFLATAGAVVGMNPHRLLFVQGLLSALTSVILALLTTELTGRRAYGLVAGYLHAVSLLAITMSGVLLSETVFYALAAASLWLLIRGLRGGSIWWFPVSGGLLAAAVLTRSFAQLVPVLYIGVGIVSLWPLTRSHWPTIKRRLMGVAIASLVPLVACVGWATHNQSTYGVSKIALASEIGKARLVRFAMSRLDGWTWQQTDSVLSDLIVHHPLYQQDGRRAFMEISTAEFKRQFAERPMAMVRLLANNAWDNITTEDVSYWFPEKPGQCRSVLAKLERIPNLRYRGILLVCLGALLLWRSREYRALIVALGFCLYFGLVSAMALFQGSRIFFPAQLTGLALTAVVWVRLWEWGASRFRSRKVSGDPVAARPE